MLVVVIVVDRFSFSRLVFARFLWYFLSLFLFPLFLPFSLLLSFSSSPFPSGGEGEAQLVFPFCEENKEEEEGLFHIPLYFPFSFPFPFSFYCFR